MSNEYSALLGVPGTLHPVRVATQPSSTQRPVSFINTLGGRKAFLGRAGLREWSVELTTPDPATVAHLVAAASGHRGPLAFYPAGAAVGNILDPRSAGLVPLWFNGFQGPVTAVDGLTLPTATPANNNVGVPWRGPSPADGGTFSTVPVHAGGPVTVSGWMTGAVSIAALWYDASDNSVATDSASVGSSMRWRRFHRSLIAPPGAVSVRFQFFCNQLAGPAVTLTSDVRPYVPGEGASRVVVHDLAEQTEFIPQAGVDAGKPFKQYSFRVTEVV